MADTKLYDVLNVHRGASDAEIKKVRDILEYFFGFAAFAGFS